MGGGFFTGWVFFRGCGWFLGNRDGFLGVGVFGGGWFLGVGVFWKVWVVFGGLGWFWGNWGVFFEGFRLSVF